MAGILRISVFRAFSFVDKYDAYDASCHLISLHTLYHVLHQRSYLVFHWFLPSHVWQRTFGDKWHRFFLQVGALAVKVLQ